MYFLKNWILEGVAAKFTWGRRDVESRLMCKQVFC